VLTTETGFCAREEGERKKSHTSYRCVVIGRGGIGLPCFTRASLVGCRFLVLWLLGAIVKGSCGLGGSPHERRISSFAEERRKEKKKEKKKCEEATLWESSNQENR